MVKLYEEVKYHSRQKHAFLEAYLRIWTQNVAKNYGEDAPSLSLLDLFAGTGWCRNTDRNEDWPGTATLLAQCMRQYPTKYPTTLFLNAYHPQSAQRKAQFESIKETLAEIGLPKRTRVILEQQPFDKALEVAQGSFDRNFPSLWVLDPYAAKDLPWTAVERIANLKGTKFERQPELFINLMTFDLLENMDPNPHIVTTALGIQESEWRSRVAEMVERGLNNREAFVQIYGQGLEQLYGRPPYAIEIEGVHGNIVYVLLFCSNNDAGFHMMRKESIPKFVEWHDKKWKPKAESIVATKKVDKKAAKAGHKQTKLGV